MIIRRILLLLAAATAFSVSAGVVIVALAYALYAFVKPEVGPAGGAAIVAAAAAVLIAIIGMVIAGLAQPKRSKKVAAEPASLTERVLTFVKEKPVFSIAAAVAAGILAVRNPSYLGTVLRAVMEGRNPPKA